MNGTIRDKIGLAGRLIGIGKIDKDGSTEFNWLEKPVSNMMLQKGVDRLFKYNWGGSYFYASGNLSGRCGYWGSGVRNFFFNKTDWGTASTSHWSYSSGPTGALAFCSYGTDDTPNDYTTTTSLGNMIAQHDQLYRPNGNRANNYPFHGTREISPGVLSMRISHILPAASANTLVKEIGWWDASYQNGSSLTNFGLTSRVVLPTPFRLGANERLITTYELIVTLGQATPTEVQFNGLTDVDGNPLYGQVRRTLTHKTGKVTSVNDCHVFNFPYIDEQGGGNIWPSTLALPYTSTDQPTTVDVETAAPFEWPYIKNYSGNKYCYVNNVAYSTVDKEIPAWGTAESGLNIVQSGAYARMANEAYVAGSHELATNITLPQFWPNLSADTDYADIHYLNIAGLAVRFGHTVDGVFVPQALRKLATQQWKIRFVTSIKTPNDT